MTKNITNIKATAAKSKTHDVTPFANGYKVTSGHSSQTYFVRLEPVAFCDCKWASYQPEGKPIACSHVQAAVRFEAAQDGYSVKVRAESDKTEYLHRKTDVLGNGVKVTLRKS